jgi:glutamate formiminotransferase
VPAAPECVECVVNVSEGRDEATLAQLAAAAGAALLDLQRDPDHHRAVLTLAGRPDDVARDARALAAAAVARLDLRTHAGAHPRLGVLDVVPFVPYRPGAAPPDDLTLATDLRDAFAQWLAEDLDVPSFLYGPLPGGRTRSLPDIRRHAFGDPATGGLAPDAGPARPHPTAGATAVGARPVLVAYNVWVSSTEVARRVAQAVRSPQVRALGLAVGPRAQVSCNLLDPFHFGPLQLYDAVAALVTGVGGAVEGAELVGLLPAAVLAHVPRARWGELGLSDAATVEARLVS